MGKGNRFCPCLEGLSLHLYPQSCPILLSYIAFGLRAVLPTPLHQVACVLRSYRSSQGVRKKSRFLNTSGASTQICQCQQLLSNIFLNSQRIIAIRSGLIILRKRGILILGKSPESGGPYSAFIHLSTLKYGQSRSCYSLGWYTIRHPVLPSPSVSCITIPEPRRLCLSTFQRYLDLPQDFIIYFDSQDLKVNNPRLRMALRCSFLLLA